MPVVRQNAGPRPHRHARPRPWPRQSESRPGSKSSGGRQILEGSKAASELRRMGVEVEHAASQFPSRLCVASCVMCVSKFIYEAIAYKIHMFRRPLIAHPIDMTTHALRCMCSFSLVACDTAFRFTSRRRGDIGVLVRGVSCPNQYQCQSLALPPSSPISLRTRTRCLSTRCWSYLCTATWHRLLPAVHLSSRLATASSRL